ncbi:MAG: hypothetical protein IJ835_07310 [Muribaculaceae bacterium]|nr:hypothetical protein [Muribaculaceae bacterium]
MDDENKTIIGAEQNNLNTPQVLPDDDDATLLLGRKPIPNSAPNVWSDDQTIYDSMDQANYATIGNATPNAWQTGQANYAPQPEANYAMPRVSRNNSRYIILAVIGALVIAAAVALIIFFSRQSHDEPTVTTSVDNRVESTSASVVTENDNTAVVDTVKPSATDEKPQQQTEPAK